MLVLIYDYLGVLVFGLDAHRAGVAYWTFASHFEFSTNRPEPARTVMIAS